MHADVFQTMNAGYAQLMYEQWLRDPTSVDEEWRAAFNNGWKGVDPGPGEARLAGGAPTHGRPDAPTHGRTDAPEHGRTGAPTQRPPRGGS
jgi:2-oxoglutarate dehydrogenase complex dehydrogenase (E1) component-like enzyme